MRFAAKLFEWLFLIFDDSNCVLLSSFLVFDDSVYILSSSLLFSVLISNFEDSEYWYEKFRCELSIKDEFWKKK